MVSSSFLLSDQFHDFSHAAIQFGHVLLDLVFDFCAEPLHPLVNLRL